MKVAGTCYVNVDGTQLVVNGAVTVPMTDVIRETIKPGYFSEMSARRTSLWMPSLMKTSRLINLRTAPT